MGITNVLFPQEACPYGVDCELLELIDPAPDPEDAPDITTGLRGVDNFANFLRLLGPPTRGDISQEVLLGEQIFRLDLLQPSRVSTVAVVTFIFPLLPGETDLFGIDNDQEIARIEKVSIPSLVFAH
jgi:hypothetical protein